MKIVHPWSQTKQTRNDREHLNVDKKQGINTYTNTRESHSKEDESYTHQTENQSIQSNHIVFPYQVIKVCNAL